MIELPPILGIDQLKLEIRLIPAARKEDARSEAWVGYLEATRRGSVDVSGDTIRHVKAWSARERRRYHKHGFADRSGIDDRYVVASIGSVPIVARSNWEKRNNPGPRDRPESGLSAMIENPDSIQSGASYSNPNRENSE